MQRLELIKEISEKTGVEKKTVETLISVFIGSIQDKMIEGEDIALSKFGHFCVKKRAAKMGRNISKNAPVKIPSQYLPVFKPSKLFTDNVRKKLRHT